MIRRVIIAAATAAGLLAPFSAAPASAGSGVGCSGNDCSVLLSNLITLNGAVGSGASGLPVPVAPPPCLWEPIGDAVSGSSYIPQQFGPTPAGAPYGVPAWEKRRRRRLSPGHARPGTWPRDTRPPRGAGSRAGRPSPFFFCARRGPPRPAGPLPPLTLAEYAYNHMLIPVPAVTINPAARGYVNLATYVWGTWAASPTTGLMNAYKITATLGAQTVTVWAQPASFTVNVTGPGTAFSGGCGPTGSRFPVNKPPASSGPGTPPDCGALWRAPTSAAAIGATVRWNVTWGVGNLNGPGNNALPPVLMTGPNPPLQFPVREIQSVNGGG